MPAIDLREGACVQLVGGSYANERVREPDPVRVAERWRACGFTQLHVVDLDAATGVGSNEVVVRSLLEVPDVGLQLAGGRRSEAAIECGLRLGARTVVVGTRALEDPQWLAACAARWPHRIVVAVDVARGRPVVRGWLREAPITLDTALAQVASLPLAAVLVTCVDVEGRMQGPDFYTLELVRKESPLPLIASGGITTLADLRTLQAMGAWGAVVGMALYTGTLDARATAEEFGR